MTRKLLLSILPSHSALRETRKTITRSHIATTERLCFAGLATVLLLSLPAHALAICLPVVPTSSFLESLARHTPSSRPLTDSEILALLEKGAVTLPPLQVAPLRGPAPLTVDVRWAVYPVDSPVRSSSILTVTEYLSYWDRN